MPLWVTFFVSLVASIILINSLLLAGVSTGGAALLGGGIALGLGVWSSRVAR